MDSLVKKKKTKKKFFFLVEKANTAIIYTVFSQKKEKSIFIFSHLVHFPVGFIFNVKLSHLPTFTFKIWPIKTGAKNK